MSRLRALTLAAAIATTYSNLAFSHSGGPESAPLVTTGLDVALSYSYRDKTYSDEDSEWQIPGALMGGEAFPVEDDAALDDALADYQYAFTPDAGIQITAEAHGGHGETEFNFRHYWYLQQWRLSAGTVRLEAGQMAAAFAPHSNWHASRDAYSEATLTGNIFWGRSLVDRGVRATYLNTNWTLGMELWSGHSWLADNGQAADVFARYQWSTGPVDYQIGAWLLAAEPEQRRDTRYFGGHSHGNVTVTSNDAAFSGDVQAAGLDLSASWRASAHSALTASISLSQLEQDGDVVESNRQAGLDSEYQSILAGLSWRYHRHELAGRVESINLDNTLSGAAAVLVGQNTSLDNPRGTDPERTTLSYRFHYNPHLTVRTEWVDETLGGSGAEVEQDRWVIGVVLRRVFR